MGNCFGRYLSGKSDFRHSTDDQEEEFFPEEASNNNLIFRIMKFKKKRPNIVNNLMSGNDSNYTRLNQTNSVNTVCSSDIQLQCLNAQSLMLTARETQYTRFLDQSDGNGAGVATSSRASSSLDLEWEHEYGHINPLHSSWLFLSDDLSNKNSNNCEDDDINDTDKHSGCSSMTNLAKNRNALLRIQQHQHQQQQCQLMTNNNCVGIQNGKGITRIPSRTSWSHISTPDSLEWDIDEEQQKQLRLEDDNLDHETLELLHEIEILKNKVLNETGEGLDFEFSKDEGS